MENLNNFQSLLRVLSLSPMAIPSQKRGFQWIRPFGKSMEPQSERKHWKSLQRSKIGWYSAGWRNLTTDKNLITSCKDSNEICIANETCIKFSQPNQEEKSSNNQHNNKRTYAAALRTTKQQNQTETKTQQHHEILNNHKHHARNTTLHKF